MRDLLAQYRESLEAKAELKGVLLSDSLAHQIAQRMLDVSSGLSERLRTVASAELFDHCPSVRDRMHEAADALDLAEAEKAEADKAWEEFASKCWECRRNGEDDYYFNGLGENYLYPYVEPGRMPLTYAQITKAKDRIAKRGGVR